ncbi:unnamed protein product [Cuscuta campestris]|uniref:non-specific serine/threonine protein kinase n=1 Tax=Cuscuta campestris TaxID=132261 RepID=A0A484K0P3_9ASTE|nr:unnamed protein product [Cuscuta campestris]
MGSFPRNSEIEELKPEKSHHGKPPVQKRGPTNKFLAEDDINRLFDAIDLRTSKSLDLSDRARRDASKRPMRPGGGGGGGGLTANHEPVSLKQAFRGLCISQAAEMASMRRLSKTPGGSPGPELGSSSFSSRVLVPPYSLSRSEHSSPRHFINPAINSLELTLFQETTSSSSSMKSPKRNLSSPQVVVKIKDSDGDVQSLKTAGNDEKTQEKGTTGPRKLTRNPSRSGGTPIKAAPRLRRKGRLQTTPLSNNKDFKQSRNASRAVKPAIRNKNLASKKKPKVESLQVNPSDEKKGVTASGNDKVTICQRCQCALKDTKDDGAEIQPATPVVPNKSSKYKGDFSQSSKSSMGDYSSSTTFSEESNLSGPCSGIRPHMSKDSRWDAINRVKKQNGFLGLIHFNLLRKLGCGDIGTVYLAELVGTSCLFAIKVMDNEFLALRKKAPRAQTEREILRMLDHPFLPTLYAQFTSDNLSCLVMEFCPGGDLHVIRQQQPNRFFPESAARFYVAEVLLALEYLHMLGVVYRDLKPENVMVREDGHIMLTDFDLSLRCSVNPTLLKSSSSLGMDPARVSGPCTGSNCIDPFCAGPSCQVSCFTPRILTPAARARKLAALIRRRSMPQVVVEPTEARSNSFVGTHEYLAPEIIKGEGHGSGVDWWTLGVFLYELLYGRTPFKGAENDETLANVVLQSLRFPDGPMVSFQARDLMRGLLVKEPEQRLGSETGAAEIKRHPFFDGLNWALIRCAAPPLVPELCDLVETPPQRKFLAEGDEHIEFDLF